MVKKDDANRLALIDANLSAPAKRRGKLAPRVQTPAQREARIRELREASVAENTKRSYSSDLRQYLATERILPATEEDLAGYVSDYEGILKPETIAHHLRALSKWHREFAYRDPTQSELIKSVLAGVRRRNLSTAKQARALSMNLVRKLDAHLSHEGLEISSTDLRKRTQALAAIRDNALLQLGFFGAFRRSELVAIRVEHITWEPKGILVLIPRSKTDQDGAGITRAVLKGADKVCPVTTLRKWLDTAGITSGPVFRPLTGADRNGEKALSDRAVARNLVARLEEIGVENADEYSGHSLRRGLATSAYLAGADQESIKVQGGWKSDASVSRYISTAKQFERNATGPLLASVDDTDGAV